MVINYIYFISLNLLLSSFFVNASPVDDLKASYKTDLLGISGGLNVNLAGTTDSRLTNSLTKMTTISTTEDATIADFSMDMNCKTGAISMTGSLPELNNFSDAMKVFAPYAVNDKGEIDFGNLLSELASEYALEKVTEEALNYVAYIHYYLTGSMGDSPVSDLMLFKTKEYKECVSQTFSSSFQETLSAGFGMSTTDDLEVIAGLDIPQLIKKAYCSFKFTGVDVGESERIRYNKSKALVRAIFNNLLNGNLDFNLNQSAKCKELDDVINGFRSSVELFNKEGVQRCVNGEAVGLDGTSTGCVLQSETAVDYVDDAGQDGSIDPKAQVGVNASDLAQTDITSDQTSPLVDSDKSPTDSDTDTASIKTGSQQTKTRYGFSTKIIFSPSSLFMDKVDLTVDERYSFYDDTIKSFKKSLKSASFYQSMTTPSRDEALSLIDKIARIQQLNSRNLNKLQCASNKNNCQDGYEYITLPEYNRVVENNGRTYECKETKKVAGINRCVREQAIEDTMYKDFSDSIEVSDAKKRRYINKLVYDTMFYYLYVYLQSHYGLVFEEDSNYLGDDSNVKGPSSLEFIGLRMGAHRQAENISKYWTSPVSGSVDPSIITRLKVMSLANGPVSRSDFVNIITSIMEDPNNNDDSSLSFAPYIYEPMNEMQLAKILYYLTENLNLKKISSDKSDQELSVSIKRFFDFSSQVTPEIINLLEVNYTAGYNNNNYYTRGWQAGSIGASSPFSPIEITTSSNTKKISKFLYQKESKSKNILSLEEFDNVVKIVDSFKDFYIKRLLDVYVEKYRKVAGTVFNELTVTNSLNETRVKDLEYEVKKLSFRMVQRREMLKLLINE